MASTEHALSVREKLGYSLGDLAANLIFQTLMTFLAFFYTDVYKVPPGAASAIIFTGGMIGAFFRSRPSDMAWATATSSGVMGFFAAASKAALRAKIMAQKLRRVSRCCQSLRVMAF